MMETYSSERLGYSTPDEPEVVASSSSASAFGDNHSASYDVISSNYDVIIAANYDVIAANESSSTVRIIVATSSIEEKDGETDENRPFATAEDPDVVCVHDGCLKPEPPFTPSLRESGRRQRQQQQQQQQQKDGGSQRSGNRSGLLYSAIPIMPLWLAVACCCVNIFLPGIGE